MVPRWIASFTAVARLFDAAPANGLQVLCVLDFDKRVQSQLFVTNFELNGIATRFHHGLGTFAKTFSQIPPRQRRDIRRKRLRQRIPTHMDSCGLTCTAIYFRVLHLLTLSVTSEFQKGCGAHCDLLTEGDTCSRASLLLQSISGPLEQHGR